MVFYIIGFLLFVLTVFANIKPQKRCLPSGKKTPWTADKIGILFIAVVLGLILVLQSAESNGDLIQYENSYNRLALRDFSYFQTHWDAMKDPFYYLCAFCFAKLGFSFMAWKALVSVVFILAVYRLILRYSANASVSFIVLLTLGLYGFALSGLRQTIAFAVILFAYPYLKEKKLLKFILMVLFAGLFHSTAWICILIYPIYRLQARVRNLLILMACSVPILLSANRLVAFYIRLVGTEEIYADYLTEDGGLSIAGLVIWGSIWLFCTVFLYRKKGDASDPHLCNLLFVSFVIRILSVTAYANFFRISMYFSLFECLAIADACACKERSNLVVRLKTAAVSVALFLYYFVAQNANILAYTA